MSKWVSFRDLINRLDIIKFEILEYLKGALKPYSKDSGRPLDCPSFCHIGHLNEDIIKAGLEVLSEANGRDLNEYNQLMIAWKENAEKELEDIKKDDPSYCSWKWFKENLSDDEFKRLFSYLDEAVFRLDDVLEFEKKFKRGTNEESSEVHYQKVFPCEPGTPWNKVIITRN